MTRSSNRGGRAAFTLLEMMVVTFFLGLIITLTTLTLMGIFRIQRAGTAAYHMLLRQKALADLFREDVARAAEAPKRLDDLVKGPTCLILKMPDGSRVVYTWDQKALQRSEKTGPGENKMILSLGTDQRMAEFSWSEDERIIILRVQDRPVPKRLHPSSPFEIVAALGGDLR